MEFISLIKQRTVDLKLKKYEMCCSHSRLGCNYYNIFPLYIMEMVAALNRCYIPRHSKAVKFSGPEFIFLVKNSWLWKKTYFLLFPFYRAVKTKKLLTKKRLILWAIDIVICCYNTDMTLECRFDILYYSDDIECLYFVHSLALLHFYDE